MARAVRLPPVPLWMWPTVLALDAPLVAVAWQAACAAALGVALRPAEVLVLALSVWLAYSADRLLDGLHLAPLGAEEARGVRNAPLRHAFAALRRRRLGGAWLLLLILDLTLAATLHPRTLLLGVGLLLLVGLYMATTHLPGPRRTLPRWLGAGQVGILFAGGVALFPVARAFGESAPMPYPPAFGLLLFAALCCANVLLIGRWEVALDDGRRAATASGAGGGRALATLATAAATVLLVMDLASGSAAGLAFDASLVAAGALLLTLAAAERIPVGPRRVLADAALLTPLPILALSGLLSRIAGG